MDGLAFRGPSKLDFESRDEAGEGKDGIVYYNRTLRDSATTQLPFKVLRLPAEILVFRELYFFTRNVIN